MNKKLLASGISAVLGLASSVSFAEPIQVGASPVSLEDIPYRHPLLQGGMPVEKLPFDDLNSPNSSRYAVMEGISVDENGVETKISDVVEVEKKPLSPEERQEIAAEKKKRHGPPPPKQQKKPSKIGHGLAKAIEVRSGNGSEPIDVLISVTRVPQPPLFDKMEKAVARGEILTKADHKRVKGELLAERQFEIEDAKFPVLDAIAELGGEVTYNAENLHSVVAYIPADAVKELAQRSDVARIDLNIPLENEVDGSHIIEGHQIKQFIDNGYDGYNGVYPNYIYFAQIEDVAADDEHVGFHNGSGSTDRIHTKYNCDSSSCSTTTDFTSSQEDDHASAVAGIIFGDLREGQDSGVTTSSARLARSGYAGEARGWLYRGTDFNPAMDDIAGKTGGTKPAIANMSAGYFTSDPNCKGQDVPSINANEMFESGTLLIKSAGNAGHLSTSDCTVTSPGSAIGVFTVGSLSERAAGNTTTVRDATISSFSSRGGTGTSTEGGNRTIIDIAAFGCRTLLFDDAGGYTYSDCGTSYAAPTVTATAIDFIDFYHQKYSDLIDNPGILFANLLLMGDRQQDSSTKRTTGFDNLYGAGALRARQFDTFGLDSPYAWATGWTCIDNNETHIIPINSGNVISSDVEAFKAVLWWYDSRHENDGTLDDIDMTLMTTSGSYLETSFSYDNKERVFYDVGGLAVQLQIYGWHVTADNAGCGTNSMKVYYAYFYEDSDRDDSDGPGSEIETE